MNETARHPIVEILLNNYPEGNNFTPIALESCLTLIRDRIFEYMKDEEEVITLSDWLDIKKSVQDLPDSLLPTMFAFIEIAEEKYQINPVDALHFVDSTLAALRDAMKRFSRQ